MRRHKIRFRMTALVALLLSAIHLFTPSAEECGPLYTIHRAAIRFLKKCILSEDWALRHRHIDSRANRNARPSWDPAPMRWPSPSDTVWPETVPIARKSAGHETFGDSFLTQALCRQAELPELPELISPEPAESAFATAPPVCASACAYLGIALHVFRI